MKHRKLQITSVATVALMWTSLTFGQAMLPVLPTATDEPRHALLRRWLPRAEAGDPEGQYTIGLMQVLGKGGVTKNVESGLLWLKMSAAQGFAEAEVELGVAYKFSNDVKADPAEARRWFERAAKRGNARAQLLLGVTLDDAKDHVGAAHWYMQAALQGRSDAQHLLGLMYRDGLGVQKSATEAVKWFRAAAAKESPDGQYDLGACYANGFGLPPDQVTALAWFKLSAARGHEDARVQVERLGELLNAADLRKADTLAREWKPGTGSFLP